MNNKKLLSIITLAGVVGMNVQSIAQNTAQSKNTILLANRNISSNIQEKVDSNIHNIKDNVITINNVWNQNIGSLKFNSLTNKIEFVNGWAETNPYAYKAEELFSISLYKSNGELIKSVQVHGDEHPEQELDNAFNNLNYTYGDVLEISYKISSKIGISNFNNEKTYQVTKPISMEITKDGLKELSNKLTVNPIYFNLGSNKIDVSGNATPNSTVNIWINNKDYVATADSKGKYNLEIAATGKITPDTVVKVFNGGNANVQKNVELNPTNYKLNYTSISLNGYWGGNPYLVSKIGFNQYTKKLELENKGNTYFSCWSNSPAYTITLLNKNGGIIKSETYKGSGSSQNVFNDFNGLSFEYGDSIKIQAYGLDMSVNNPDGKIDNIPGKGTKTVEYEIAQDGLREVSNNLTVNPIYYELNSNKIDVSGKTTAKTLVNIWVDNKDYTTTSNSNGEYNLNIEVDKAVTSSTKVEVFVDGEKEQTLNPILNPNIYKIQSSAITINNGWGSPAGTITFNPVTMKMNVSGYNLYLGHNSNKFLTISTYNSKSGQQILSQSFNGNDNTNVLAKYIDGKSFEYGEIIGISYDSSQGKVSVINNSKNIGNTNGKMEFFKITQDGLKELPNNLTVNPIYYELNSNKMNVSGKTTANTLVNIWIDNKDYTTTSNSNGEYNLNIKADKAITASTKVVAFVEGEGEQVLNPILNPNIYKIQSSAITINNGWGTPAGTITFNPVTMKMNVSGYNLYLGHNSNKFLTISTYNGQSGKLTSAQSFNGNDNTNVLAKYIDGKSFEYGEIIGISYDSSQGKVSVLNNSTNVGDTDGKIEFFKITQDGLEPCNMPQVQVNPFDVLGNGKVTSGVISGKIDKPNQEVNVIVDGKTFSGKSNANGDFKINISDASGFTDSTNIFVETVGELTTIVNPTVDTNLGILNSNITISDKDQDGTFGQMITFNPANMTVNNHGSNFAAQLISGKTGQVLASCSTSNFNVFASKNKLNGAHFEYGDIIAVYEPQETELSMGELLLDSGKSKIDCTNKFKCFKITKNGLVPVANGNLTTSQILYKGTNNMNLTGKTLPNTDVTVTYGETSKVVKSNSDGDFSLEIPVSEAPINSEVRIFVNNDNAEILTVQYDTKLININSNRIQVVNNTNVPIFNVTFNPVNNKLQAIEYPLAKQYTGAFYSNTLNIRLIDPKNGDIIYSFTGDKLNDISAFISEINNKSYEIGDIIEVSYNPNLVKANIFDGKNSIGNTTGEKEYFEITNKGLINLNDKFINIKPLDILSNNKVTSTNIEGTAKPNTSVEVSVDRNTFKGMTNRNGEFNIAINDKDGFTSNTNIVVSSEGYIPTIINPTIESNIQLMNSYINFYNNQGWQGELSSSVTFNPQTMKFVVNNYTDSFGNGKSKYLDLGLYSSNGQKLLDASINNGSTSQLTEVLNGKSFSYGDIIGLSYNNTISKPVVLNGNQVLGNISGNEEYFKITKEGLVPVNFGQKAYTTNVAWDNNNLVIDSNLSDGQSESILNADKKLVILNSSNQVVDSINTSTLDNNPASVQGIIPESVLYKLNKDEAYTFALDINNELFPIQVSSNTSSNSKYVLEANSDNTLSIITATAPVITINNANNIASYMNTLTSDINTVMNQNTNIDDIPSNSKLSYKIAARDFISRVGVDNLENFFNGSEANKEFVNWLLNNSTAIQEYLDATSQSGVNINGLQIWSDIWNKYTNSRAGFNLKLAVAVAVSNAKPINAWPGKGTVGDPVERYNIFETLNAEGGMLPIFRTLDVRHIMYVVNTHIPNSQILEMRAIIMQNHNAFINAGANGLNNIAYTIQYNEINPHTGASIFGPDFYGPNPSPLNVWYDGGVCGSTSYMGASACQVFGLPAQPVGQPGHCAFIFYNDEHKWTIGNNIFGWSQSSGADISGWSKGIATNGKVTNYDLLYENINPETLKKSNEYLWLANSVSSYQDKMNAINEALKIEPLNVRAWLDKIALMKTNHNLTVEDYINLSDQIINALKDYPMPMLDTLLQIKNIILNSGTKQDYNNYIKAIDNALNSVTNSNQKPIAKEMLQTMPSVGLQDGEAPLVNSKITINNVWSQSLATLGFNPVSMKMTVNKGWSEVNPYLNGEAFSIGLYDKDNKLIKSITLNGGEHPENAIYNEFNNLGFKYGDKIFIDYKISCNINASNLYKDGVLEKSYNVNKPSVFELTPRGLVYLGDSLEDSSENATLKVSTVYPDGKAVAGDKYNYTETGNIGDSINNESIPALENYHVDYVTVNGVKADINQLPKYYLDNNMNIVYHMAIDSEYKLNINVKTESGKVLNTIPAVSYAKGDKISVADNNWDKKEYKLDYILVDGVKTPADKLPEVMPDKNLNITYVVSPIAKSTITVKTMVDGKVLGKPVVTTNYEGEAYKEVAPTWDNNDYELKDITVNGVKTSEADLPKVFGDKDTTIVYNLSLKMMNVGERVVNQNGDVLYHNEYKLPFNTSIVNIEDKIPSNYKLENITVSNLNNKEATLIANTKANTYTNSNDVKVAFNGEVVSYNVVPINGEITYETQIGNEEPTNVVKEVGQVDTKSKEYKLDIPKGYKVESITVNGKKVDSVNDLDYKNEKQVVVYHLAKIPATKPVVDHNTENKPSIDKHDNKPAGNHEIGNTDDKAAVDHNTENKPSADNHDNKPAVKPAGNHEGNTDNKPAVDHNTENKPSTNNHTGTKATPAKVEHGEVIVKVIDQNGKVVEEVTHNGVIGLKFNPITIPSKDKLANVTINGNTVSENDVKNEIVSNPDTDNKTIIIYNVDVPENNNQGNIVNANGKSDINNTIGSDKNNSTNIPDNVSPVTNNNKNNSSDSNKKDITEGGNVKVEVIADNGRVIYSTDSNEKVGSEIESVNIPSGYHIDSVDSTVNGTNVNTVPTKVVKGDTVIIYHVSKIKKVNQEPAKVEKGTVKEEIITNDGKILLDSNYNEPVGSKINKVVIPSGYKLQSVSTTINGNKVQEVPIKVDKGETTIIYNVVSDEPAVNHNEDNTDKNSDAKPVVNHNENTTDNHNDVKPEVNHNGDNTDKNSDVKPVVNHNENTTNNHNDAKPAVNHNGNTTDNSGNLNSGESNNSSNSGSTTKGDNGETVNKIGLPDTGLNNTENDLGLLAGIMAAIAAIGIFRRKK